MTPAPTPRREDDGPWPMPVQLVRGLTGAGLACGWSIAVGIIGIPGLDRVAFGTTYPVSAALTLLGTTLGFLVMLLLQRALHRGPELNRWVLYCVSTLSALALTLVVALEPRNVAALVPVCAALCVLLGACASYAVRRTAMIVDSASNWHYPSVTSRMTSAGTLVVGALFSLAVACMDPHGGCAFLCGSVPLSLVMLPQGRLSLVQRPQSPERETLSPSWAYAPLTCAAALGVCLGLTDSMVPWGLASGFDVTRVTMRGAWFPCLGVLAFALLARFPLARVPRRHQTASLQASLVVECISLGLACATIGNPAISARASLMLSCLPVVLGVVPLAQLLSALATGRADRGARPNAKPLVAGLRLFLVGMFAGTCLSIVANAIPAQTLVARAGFACVAVALFLGAVLLGTKAYAGTILESPPACAATPSGAPGEFAAGPSEQLPSDPALRSLQAQPHDEVKAHDCGPLSADGTPGPAQPGGGVSACPSRQDPASSGQAEGGSDGRRTLTPEELRAQRCADVALRYGLSERQHDLLLLLYDGMNAQEVADTLFISRNTAKTHMAHIYSKLGIHTRAELDAILGVGDGEGTESQQG